MQVSLYWVNELLDIRGYKLLYYIRRLICQGIEVEDYLEVTFNNTRSLALEISTTTNRGDALCIRGIAREFKGMISRRKTYSITPARLKTVYTMEALRLLHTFHIPVLESAQLRGLIRYRKMLKYNTVRKFPKPSKKSLLDIKHYTVQWYQWKVENTVFRSHRQKFNLKYKETVFNSRDPKLYSKFICWSVENLSNLNTPKWLQKKLAYSGISAQNNLSDFQNYIRLESGYPFEFYDLEKIYLKCKNNKFKLSLSSESNTNILATNNITYPLTNDILVVKANKNILSVAGVISNKDFSYTNQTTSLLIEGSIFNSKMIRRQSKLLNVTTTRSACYGKGGVDGDFVLETLYRLLLLLKINNPDLNCILHTASYSAQTESQIYHVPYVSGYDWHAVKVVQLYDLWFREKRLNQIIGQGYQYNSLTQLDFANVFTKKMLRSHFEFCLKTLEVSHELRFRPGQADFWSVTYGRIPFPPDSSRKRFGSWLPPRKTFFEDRCWILTIPSRRREDITREIDIIEEVCRLYGVDRIFPSLYKADNIGAEDLSYTIRKKITRFLLTEGFNELISYSLVNDKLINDEELIKLVNPLAQEYSTLRRSLLPNLIQSAAENIKQGNSVFQGFECGHVFLSDLNNKYLETEYFSGIFGGIKVKSEWSKKLEDLSWFEAKGKVEKIFETLGITTIWKESTNTIYSSILHPYRSANIFLGDNKQFGIFGQINPILARKINISSTLYLFEFNFKLLCIDIKSKENINLNYKSYSSYPKIIKDLSFIIDKNISFSQIKETIDNEKNEFLMEVKLLDNYQGETILSNQLSLCIQLTFQSQFKTLKNDDIDPIVNQIFLTLKTKYNVILRS